MNDDFTPAFPGAESPAPPREDHTLGASTIFKLCSEVIQLRERNDRTHRDFEYGRCVQKVDHCREGHSDHRLIRT